MKNIALYIFFCCLQTGSLSAFQCSLTGRFRVCSLSLKPTVTQKINKSLLYFFFFFLEKAFHKHNRKTASPHLLWCVVLKYGSLSLNCWTDVRDANDADKLYDANLKIQGKKVIGWWLGRLVVIVLICLSFAPVCKLSRANDIQCTTFPRCSRRTLHFDSVFTRELNQQVSQRSEVTVQRLLRNSMCFQHGSVLPGNWKKSKL